MSTPQPDPGSAGGDPPDPEALLRALPGCMLRDEIRLRARLLGLRRGRPTAPPEGRDLLRIAREIERSRARREWRDAHRPEPSFPEELPVSERRGEIAAAVREHPVVIVAGETGSGKTTQLPKICLALERGVRGEIACTQPRRIAATSVADRVASELGTRTGEAVGYRIRFEKRTGPRTFVSFLTDGVLLAELQNDRQLLRYDTLIIDEAHERSLNIDYLLGAVTNLLPRRPDLRVLISSATLDVERFSAHFGDAPVVEVTGRAWPVEVRYRPPPDDPEEEADPARQIVEAVEELDAAEQPGDILVFLAGERDIREAQEALEGRALPRTVILPLFARLSGTEQRRIFLPDRRRKIVLATNVAETSLTVPGIRAVIDTGRARIHRYNHRTQVERLQIERVSRASADQRKGRCGRIGPGICIRLYSEEDYADRPAFTDPEIRRTSLASVILQMKAMRLGAIETFPFLDPPAPPVIRDGYDELYELGALDGRKRLTPLGRRMAGLSVEPRHARMLLEAEDRGALGELLVIAAALSIQDPRERPLDRREAADRAHARWKDETSDFLGFLRLWEAYDEAERTLPSGNRLRRWCREHFLSWRRMREWRDVRTQLEEEMRAAGVRRQPRRASPEAIHRSVLAGLLSHIGMKTDQKDYRGARGKRFHIFPGSGLFGRLPRWVMAAEQVLTTKLYARNLAEIDPRWAEEPAEHLLERSQRDPHWDEETGFVRAYERVTVYGLAIVEKRRIDYGRVDPVGARRLFIEEALVRGRLGSRTPFLRRNLELVEEVQAWEQKLRRTDLLIDEEALFAFYDSRLPAEIHNRSALRRWYRRLPSAKRHTLYMKREDVLLRRPDGLDESRFPSRLDIGSAELPLQYRFAPGEEEDGVSCDLPVGTLAGLEAWRFGWLVPGLLPEKVALLLRTLPRSLRRDLVPVPDTVEAVLPLLGPPTRPLEEALVEALRTARNVVVDPSAFRPGELPPFLHMRFRVRDEAGRLIATGRDLEALRASLAREARLHFVRSPKEEWEQAGLEDWSAGTLPERVDLGGGHGRVFGYPALRDDGMSVSLRLYDSPGKAAEEHPAGTRRLIRLVCREDLDRVRRGLPIDREALLRYAALGGTPDELLDDIIGNAIHFHAIRGRPPIREEAAFRARIEETRREFRPLARTLAGRVDRILADAQETAMLLQEETLPVMDSGVRDMREQLGLLVRPGFVRELPPDRSAEVPRYLEALRIRLDRLRRSPAKDAARMEELAPHWQRLREAIDRGPSGFARPEPVLRFRWMVEEYRVSLFAQELGTDEPVSAKRLERQWDAARRSLPD